MLCIIFKSRIEKNPHLLSLSFSRFLKFACITISSRIQKLPQRNRCSSRFSHFGLVMNNTAKQNDNQSQTRSVNKQPLTLNQINERKPFQTLQTSKPNGSHHKFDHRSINMALKQLKALTKMIHQKIHFDLPADGEKLLNRAIIDLLKDSGENMQPREH